MLLALLGALLVLSAATTGCETLDGERADVVALANRSRAQAGIGLLTPDVALDLKADAWARQIRDACRLSHSRLQDGAPQGWVTLGENVGFGGSIGEVHAGYLESPGHRRNILDSRFTHIGAAAVWGDCGGQRRVFTVQVFAQIRR